MIGAANAYKASHATAAETYVGGLKADRRPFGRWAFNNGTPMSPHTASLMASSVPTAQDSASYGRRANRGSRWLPDYSVMRAARPTRRLAPAREAGLRHKLSTGTAVVLD